MLDWDAVRKWVCMSAPASLEGYGPWGAIKAEGLEAGEERMLDLSVAMGRLGCLDGGALLAAVAVIVAFDWLPRLKYQG